jgi:molybdopterin-guanine dinucleotide biosynthesis protein A
MTRLFAIILAGGRSARMGRDKGSLRLEGRSLVARAVGACAGCDGIVVVAPELPDEVDPGAVGLALEDPPFGGPVAGIAAGLEALPTCRPSDEVLLLACDLPLVVDVVQHLRAVPLGADGACLVDATGRYRRPALTGALPSLTQARGRSVRSVLGRLDLARIASPGITHDLDTPADAAAAGVQLD